MMSAKTKTIPQDVLAVLGEAVIDGATVRLTQQLARPLYVQTNEVLEALGGKWSRKAKGHVFDTTDPVDILDQAILTGRYERPQDWGFFPTPGPIVARLIDAAEIEPRMHCLEPSAGQGAIAEAIAKIVEPDQLTTVELLHENCVILRAKGFAPWQQDFLTTDFATRYERIVMNPPFSRQQDIDHVRHAFTAFLMPGGRLVSVMSMSFTFRTDKKSVAFRELVEQYGQWEELPDEAFKESGTMVRTAMVVLDNE
jgi:hypothetical protein